MSITIPAIITEDLFPAIYAADVPDIYYDGSFGYPEYTYVGVPSFLKPYVDPGYVTGPQKYEYRYQNQNGIDVVIRGPYEHIMPVVDVLNTYPPSVQSTSEPSNNKKKLFDIFDLSQNSAKPANVPAIGVINDDNHIKVIINNKKYSGSGTLFIVFDNKSPLSIENAKIVLFNNPKKGRYEELGGKIDRLDKGKVPDENILFNNAKKESLEESMLLFNIANKTDNFIDIESNGEYYRVYVYLFRLDNLRVIERYYAENKQYVYNSPIKNDSYRETNDLKLFSYGDLIATIESSNTFRIFGDGSYVKINPRTLNVLKQLKDTINNMINNGKESSVGLQIKNSSEPYNTITIN